VAPQVMGPAADAAGCLGAGATGSAERATGSAERATGSADMPGEAAMAGAVEKVEQKAQPVATQEGAARPQQSAPLAAVLSGCSP